MSLLLKLVYDVARVRSTYAGIHQEVLGAPARALVSRLVLRRRTDFQRCETELASLCAELAGIRQALSDLTPTELVIRRGTDIRSALWDYSEALEISIARLREICARLDRSSGTGRSGEKGSPTVAATAADRRAYDDAIQHHRHMGARLTELLSTY